jgi:N-acyl-D-aspartate/D-glutamate deacylase
MLDLLITAGTVVDGTGAPRRRGDVGIVDGRVVAIGDIADSARRTIDADGRIVAPGFVDVHTHLDAQVFWDNTVSPSPLHGVTTVMAGNCGFTVAPLVEREARFLMRMLARVEGMPLISLETAVPWDWATTADYFERVAASRPAVNMGFMVGHSTLRRVVMGDAASERTATPDEIVAMASLLRAGLAAGGLGFSSTWAATHNDGDGVPVPSRFADADELVQLAAVCRDYEGTSLEFLARASGDFDDASMQVMARMSAAAQRTLNWNVINPSLENRDMCLQRLGVSDPAREMGGRVVGLVMPIRTLPHFTFKTGYVLDMLPGWAGPMTAPHAERLAMLRDPAGRRRLFELAEQPSDASHLANWRDRIILETFTAETKRYQGRLVADIAREEGKTPFDALLDIVCADELRTTFSFNRPEPSEADWEVKLEIMRDPRAIIGASDAGAHLDFSASYDYPTRLLGEVVRDRGLMPLEEMISRLTDAPARLYGVRDRGRLVEGAWADIVIFDEDAISSTSYQMSFDLPGGAPRLVADPIGIDHVLVNGAEIAARGTFTERRPGRLLRSGTDTTTPPLDP